MSSSILSEEALQAIVETYVSFGVDCVFDPEGSPYRVRGYRNKLDHVLGNGVDLCRMDDFDAAWALVHHLCAESDCLQFNQQLQHVGIQCPFPVKGGDFHG